MQVQSRILEDFRSAVSETWARDGKNTWPVDINSITHLFMDLFFSELLDDFEKLKERGFSEQDISSMLQSPARVIRLIMPSIQGMKKMKISMDEQRRHILRLLSMAGNMKHGDPCNRDGRNIILSQREFEDSIDASKIVCATRDKSAIVHKLSGILWAYSEVMCFRAHGLSKEFHGPYSHSLYNEEFLIREFYLLNNTDLWDECGSVGYNKIRVTTAYEGMDLSVDIYNHLSIKQGSNYIDGLRYFYVEGDGNIMSLDEVDILCSSLSGVIAAITTKIETMDWRELAEKYAEIFWLTKKELRDALDLEWSFPPIVKERIRNGEMNTRLKNLDQRDLQRFLRVAF